jgi:hypothetical protein
MGSLDNTMEIAMGLTGRETVTVNTEFAVFMFTAATGVASGVGNWLASRRLGRVDAEELPVELLAPSLVLTFIGTVIAAQYLVPESTDENVLG